MKNIIPYLLTGFLVSSDVDPVFGQGAIAPSPGKVVSFQGMPQSTMLNTNRVAAWYTCNGEQERRPKDGRSGLSYPRGTSTAVFAAGIVYAGLFMDGREPEVRFNGSEYRSGLKPGRILSLRTGEADDPLSADVRIWRIRRDFAIADLRRDAAELNYVDSSSVTQGQIDSVRHQYELDWTEWPAHMGAPFYDSNGDGTYQPRFTGRVVNGVNVPLRFPEADEPGLLDADQVIWFVANDIRVDQPWTCPESGIEIQVTVWGYDRPDPVGDALFKSGRLIYKGTNGTPADARIENMYIAQWSDPDIGFAGDDFVGCDSALSMGYAYNAVPRDTLYAEVGLVPPAVGYDYLYGPLVAGKEGEDLNRNGVDDAVDHGIRGFHRVGPGFINLPMTSFTFFDSHYVDPPYSYSAGIAMFQMMLGHPFYPLGPPYGAPIDDPITGRRTRYWVNGDPVSGEGWLDGLLHPAGERRIVLSSGPFSMAIGDTQEVAVAWIGGLGIDHKNSVRVLKSNDASVQAFFDSTLIVSGVSNGLREIPVGFILAQNYPNPFNPSTTIRYGLPSRSHVTLTVFNTLGQQAATLVEGEQEGGVYEAVFDASGLASGVYLYRLQAGGFVQVRKLMVLR